MLKIRRSVFMTVVVLGNAAAWLIPSDVLELVARDKQTLLGRYSREHFTVILVILVSSLIGLHIDWAPPAKYKRRWFQVLAGLFAAVPTLVVVDFFLRAPEQAHYVRDSVAYHRPPNQRFDGVYEDRPEAYRTYPNVEPGAETVRYVYHSDAIGFRNSSVPERCDIVVLGDSFAEGSKVSDEHVWPRRLAEATGLTIYNVGMSGYSPVHYAAALREYGLSRASGIVVCMLYEGNDFRPSKINSDDRSEAVSRRLQRYMKQSPIVQALDRLLIEHLGPIAAGKRLPELEILSWLPISLSGDEGVGKYAFAPKQLLQHRESVQMFRLNPIWSAVADLLTTMKADCDSVGARFVVVYAPTKAHVILPAARDLLPAEKVRAFAAIRSRELPEPARFMEKLYENLPAQESVVRHWCVSNDVDYLDTTDALADAATRGRQVYYAYDQHWSPDGHEVVADAVATFLAQSVRLRSIVDAKIERSP